LLASLASLVGLQKGGAHTPVADATASGTTTTATTATAATTKDADETAPESTAATSTAEPAAGDNDAAAAPSLLDRLSSHWQPRPAVAIISLQGSIVPSSTDSPKPSAWQANTISPMQARALLRVAKDDPNVKAVVLRINSGGGEAAASEAIWRDVQALRQAGKPVVASMGRVAASGGYMIASACDQIVASPATITGSIGVLAGALDASGFLKQQKVQVASLSEGSPPVRASAPLSSRQRRELRQMAADVNTRFEAKVASGREMTPRAVKRAAGGRVYTGEQAKAIGLVDSMGGVEEACALACKAAGLEGWAEGAVGTREVSEGALEGGLLAKVQGMAAVAAAAAMSSGSSGGAVLASTSAMADGVAVAGTDRAVTSAALLVSLVPSLLSTLASPTLGLALPTGSMVASGMERCACRGGVILAEAPEMHVR